MDGIFLKCEGKTIWVLVKPAHYSFMKQHVKRKTFSIAFSGDTARFFVGVSVKSANEKRI